MSNSEREEFEKWYTKKFLGVNPGNALDHHPDDLGYIQLDTHFCWLGWQARAESAQRPSVAGL